MTDDTEFTFSPLHETFVRPFYLEFLNANFRRKQDAAFAKTAVIATGNISDAEIEQLLHMEEWRGRLSASWFAGLGQRVALIPLIGDLLLASELAYAGQGYCVALGLIGTDECEELLRQYLQRYLPLNGRIYDQSWAIGALSNIDPLATPQFLQADLWRDGEQIMEPMRGISDFENLVAYLHDHQMVDGAA